MEDIHDFNLSESSMTITTLETAEKASYESPVILSKIIYSAIGSQDCSCSPTDTICIDTTHSPINAIVNIDTHHSIKITDCPKCASNLPLRETDSKGICKCSYCGKEVYVW